MALKMEGVEVCCGDKLIAHSVPLLKYVPHKSGLLLHHYERFNSHWSLESLRSNIPLMGSDPAPPGMDGKIYQNVGQITPLLSLYGVVGFTVPPSSTMFKREFSL